MNTSGQCQCGEVSFTVTGELKRLVNCHCNRCREMNGSAFSSYVVIATDNLCITSGQEKLQKFAVSDHINKHFCGNCGTPVYNDNPVTYPGLSMLYLGTLKNTAALMPSINIFCESKLPWVDTLSLIDSVNGGPHAPK
jgi:hypothetical protein